MSSTAASFAALFAALYAAHAVADHWIQTQHQSDRKGRPGWTGRLACAAHVATYTATALAAVLVVAWRCDIDLHPGRLTLALAVSAVTHYIADRRTPLRRMADALGKNPDWLTKGGGLYALDQSWHIGWLAVAALIAA
ncbi:DUF3307 domain-containing protein [Salinispora arenicola]|uniref:DUF3307 domain-containing protein n=1 Tax=Salinispora arenicola TaxID=168697 RepID=UPI0003A936A6|nr:DUF3307 domain-containing protein [Salinispora arenicola]